MFEIVDDGRQICVEFPYENDKCISFRNLSIPVSYFPLGVLEILFLIIIWKHRESDIKIRYPIYKVVDLRKFYSH